ncbi:MAG: hypothetical protein DI585_01510 [Pseudomonas fluorescens]|nr:MAG: hypothetical protein DI585_01510 [Pseudomonas fluorescens]
MKTVRNTPAWFVPGKMVTLITDKSRGFGTPGLPLYVPGAETTIEATQNFLDRIDPFVMAHVPHADTHFKAEYPHSNEAQIFPEHQLFDTEEWEYLLTFMHMRARVAWIFKNVFDIGGKVTDSGVDPRKVLAEMTDPLERKFFKGLFHVAEGDPADPSNMTFGHHRDSFFYDLTQKEAVTSLHMGDATDYCVRDALKYVLSWGHFKHVVLLTDLTHGIYNTTLPGGVANLQELIATDPVLNEGSANGRLVLATSDEVLGYLPTAEAA